MYMMYVVVTFVGHALDCLKISTSALTIYREFKFTNLWTMLDQTISICHTIGPELIQC